MHNQAKVFLHGTAYACIWYVHLILNPVASTCMGIAFQFIAAMLARAVVNVVLQQHYNCSSVTITVWNFMLPQY
jgi:hypothetical protein